MSLGLLFVLYPKNHVYILFKILFIEIDFLLRTDKEWGEVIETCAIITTEPNKVLEAIHDRMPVILKSESYNEELGEKIDDTGKLQKLLKPYPATQMKSHPISRSVNIPRENSPDLILNSK